MLNPSKLYGLVNVVWLKIFENVWNIYLFVLLRWTGHHFFVKSNFCDVCVVQLLSIYSEGAHTTQRFQEKSRPFFSAWEPA